MKPGVEAVIAQIRAAGGHIEVRNGKIAGRVPKWALDLLRPHKAAVIAFLTATSLATERMIAVPAAAALSWQHRAVRPSPCPSCGGDEFWHIVGTDRNRLPWVCLRCHPPQAFEGREHLIVIEGQLPRPEGWGLRETAGQVDQGAR